MVFTLSNGRYLKYIDEEDANLEYMADLIESNYLLVVGSFGEQLYHEYEDLKNNTTVLHNFMTSGHSDIYFIEKSPKFLKDYPELTKDVLGLFPRVNGSIFPVKIKKEIGLKQSSKEVAGVLLNYIYCTIKGDAEYSVQGMEATAILYKWTKEEAKKYLG